MERFWKLLNDSWGPRPERSGQVTGGSRVAGPEKSGGIVPRRRAESGAGETDRPVPGGPFTIRGLAQLFRLATISIILASLPSGAGPYISILKVLGSVQVITERRVAFLPLIGSQLSPL